MRLANYPDAPVQVLDHGFVHLVEMMGGDRAVVQAARVSYRSDGSKGDEADKSLIRYLVANKHTSPFEHAVFKFHIKLPLFTARQWIRHRMASYNEVSARYTEVQDAFYHPDTWFAQGEGKNKQGAGLPIPHDHQARASAALDVAERRAWKSYEELLDLGVAREQARIVLPLNAYTEWYWTLNAHALMHFIRLRSEEHAQWEMRQYSNTVWRIFARAMPWTAAAFLATLDLQKYVAKFGGVAGPCNGDLEA